MNTCEQMLRSLKSGIQDDILRRLYALDGSDVALERARARAVRVVTGFQSIFGRRSGCVLFSAPGRTEIGGNHTDHQHGRVLCGSVDLDMLACAAPNGKDRIRICSEGYPQIEVELRDLSVRVEERNTSAALVRGVAAALFRQGYSLCGFDAYVASNVLSGSGLSSSAAYEVLVGTILNHFCCGGAMTPYQVAAAGQYAENTYFGKPCGLMDQMGSAVGGAVAIDFKNPMAPEVKKVNYDFARCGHALCIVNTGSCHADLTDDYAAIPREMAAVAACFGQKVLRDVPQEEFCASIPAVREKAGDRAVLRAMHFFEEDRRAAQEAQALAEGDFAHFLALVNESGRSSAILLQNLWSPGAPEQQAVGLALALGERILGGGGAIRVHGGGFAGTIQAFVPNGLVSHFRSGMDGVLGEGNCHILHIRDQGGCVVISERGEEMK